MWIVKYRTYFFALSLVLMIAAAATMLTRGLDWGIDFTGGSILEVTYQNSRPTTEAIQAEIADLTFGNVLLQPAGTNDLIVRTRLISNEEKNQLVKALSFAGREPVTEKRFNAIGPSLGAELARKGGIAIAIVIILIVIYLTIVFWSVSRPVASWKYGVVAILKMVHDLTITTGLFVWLSAYLGGGEINALFLGAFLTVLGLSINDVIAVFDRIRENLRRRTYVYFEETVGHSLSETMARSLNTSITVILVLLCIYLLGGETTRDFALVMAIGMIVATYSSVFIASPLLVTWHNWSEKQAVK